VFNSDVNEEATAEAMSH